MKLTQKLLGYLNRVFDKAPQSFVAIGFSYAGTDMAWTVDDGALTVAVTGGVGAGFSLQLASYTLTSLAAYIAGLTGFTVNAIAPAPASGLSATVLLDATGKQSAGQNKMMGYSSILYAWAETMAVALEQAENDAISALQQINVRDADGNPSAADIWLDEIGGYFGVPRIVTEPDSIYGPRIIAEVLRAKSNNVAIESAIKSYTGQNTSVVDVVTPAFANPLYNAAYIHNSAKNHNSVGSLQYSLFDVTVGFDILSGETPVVFAAAVTAVIDRLRSAGTHMRALALTGSVILDDFSPPTDGFGTLIVSPGLGDTLTAPTGAMSPVAIGLAGFGDTLGAPGDATDHADIAYTTVHNGVRFYNAAIPHMGGHTSHGTIEGVVTSVT